MNEPGALSSDSRINGLQLVQSAGGGPTRLAPEPVSRARRTELRNRLLSAESVEELVTTFVDHVNQVIPVDGAHYVHADKQFQLEIGKPGTHRVEYSLTTGAGNQGSLRFNRSYERFHERELECLEHLLGSLIYPLQIAWLMRGTGAATRSDPVTGAGNERMLYRCIQEVLVRPADPRSNAALLLIEIDDIHQLSALHGTEAISRIEQQLVDLLDRCRQEGDRVCRVGGRRFALLLDKAEQARAAITAEHVRILLEEAPAQINGATVPLTVSIGVALREPGDTVHKLLDRADLSLFLARQSGGNQVRGVGLNWRDARSAAE